MHSPLSADVEKLSLKAILAKQQEFLWPSHLLYYTEPLALEKIANDSPIIGEVFAALR
jgi:hypothetical protein